MTLTGTSAFALVSGATTATGSFSGNDPAHQDAGGVHDCVSSFVPGKYSAWVSPVTQVIDDAPRQDCFWPFSDIPARPLSHRYRGLSGHQTQNCGAPIYEYTPRHFTLEIRS